MPSPTGTAEIVRNLMFSDSLPSRRDRYAYQTYFTEKLYLPADIGAGAYNQQNQRRTTKNHRQFSLEGTNMTSALSGFDTGGGVIVTTAGASADQAIIRPFLTSGDTDFTNQDASSLQITQFLTNKQVHCTWIVELPQITACKILIGLVSALATGATALTKGTANEQAIFHFDTADGTSATKWRCLASVGGTDTEAIATAPNGVVTADVAITTKYELTIIVDANRIPTFYINRQAVARGPALTTATAMFPVCGIEASAAAAKSLKARFCGISRVW